LLAASNQRFELLLSVPLMLEYEAVLTRPEQLAACGLGRSKVGRVLDDLVGIARAAINGGASAIVTFNQRDFAAGMKGFGCAVILPGTALQPMRSANL